LTVVVDRYADLYQELIAHRTDEARDTPLAEVHIGRGGRRVRSGPAVLA
jgi:hypothetical protein